MKKGKRKNKNTVMFITLGIVAAAILVIAVIGTMNKGGKTVPSVEVITVKKGNVMQEVDAAGTVESEEKKTFYSPVNATIKNMTVQAGDSVEQGQSLIGFNLEQLETDNQKAELAARSGKLDLQDAQEQVNTAAAKVADAQAQIPGLESQIKEKQNYINSLRQQIADAQKNAQADTQAKLEQAQTEAKAAYEAAEAAAKQKYEEEMKNYQEKVLPEYETELQKREQTRNDCQAAFNKASEDYNNGVITVEAYSEAQVQFQKAEELYQEYKAMRPAEPVKESVTPPAEQNGVPGAVTADTTGLEAQMETASAELAQLQSELASKKAVAESDVSGLTSAAKEKMRISNNLSELESKNIQELLEEGRKGILAEFKGVISDSRVKQGATVSQGMELFTLQSTEQVGVDANISKYDFDKVKEGQKAEVLLGDRKYKGTVSRVSRIAIPNEKGTPVIGISVHIDNPDDGIFIGVEAKVSIQAAEAKDVPLLPVEVVNIGKDGSFCYVIEDGVITKKKIETGITSDSYVEVKSGLKEGEKVIKDIGNFQEGDAVKEKEEQKMETKTSK